MDSIVAEAAETHRSAVAKAMEPKRAVTVTLPTDLPVNCEPSEETTDEEEEESDAPEVTLSGTSGASVR